jgi:predicted MPP superfamily phosphohydrolase
MLADAGIVRLDNQTREIVVKGQVMRVSGLSDLWAGENHPEKCLRKVNEVTGEKTPVLLLNHNPDARASLMGYEWHLMLSGHTHGGQCGIPLVNQILSPVKDKSHIEGLKEREGRLVHISRGIGNLHGIRLMCPPEVNVLEVY